MNSDSQLSVNQLFASVRAGLVVAFLWLPMLTARVHGNEEQPIAGIDIRDRDTVAESTVGMAVTIEQIVFPGSELIAKPLEDRNDPFVLRIVETYKHGSDHRYDMEVYGLEKGQYNLLDYLVRADGSSTRGLPERWVMINATLPDGEVLPSEIASTRLPYVGGYRLAWIIGGVLWILGLLMLVFAGKKKSTSESVEEASEISLADRLRPLVQSARDGSIDASGRAQLERTLIAYWCNRLDMKDLSPGESISRLRQHAEAGPLIRSLEDWLHRPDPPEQVDLNELLKPYENVTDPTSEFDGHASSLSPSDQAMRGGGN